MPRPSAANHKRKRPRPCNAERCWCMWIIFHQNRTNAKLKGGAGD